MFPEYFAGPALPVYLRPWRGVVMAPGMNYLDGGSVVTDQEESSFANILYWLMGGMVAFAVLLVLLSALVASLTTDDEMDPLSRQVLAERVTAVGQVNTGEPGQAMTAAAETPAADEPLSGEQVYRNNCAACHDSGAMQAPMISDAASWSGRLDQGAETLVRHAIEGLGQMPARGGNSSLSDEEVEAAVEYMLDQVGG